MWHVLICVVGNKKQVCVVGKEVRRIVQKSGDPKALSWILLNSNLV